MQAPWKDDSQRVEEFENELTCQTNFILNNLSEGSAFIQRFIEENDITAFTFVNAFAKYVLNNNEQEARKVFIADVAKYLMPYINDAAHEKTIKVIGYDIY